MLWRIREEVLGMARMIVVVGEALMPFLLWMLLEGGWRRSSI